MTLIPINPSIVQEGATISLAKLKERLNAIKTDKAYSHLEWSTRKGIADLEGIIRLLPMASGPVLVDAADSRLIFGGET